MDSISRPIGFDFDKLCSDVGDQREDWQLLLRVDATFQVTVDERVFFNEPSFAIIEFGVTASAWLHNEGDLNHRSMESSENPLLAFYEIDNDLFRPYSPYQNESNWPAVEKWQLRGALDFFVRRLKKQAYRDLAIDLSRVICWPPASGRA